MVQVGLDALRLLSAESFRYATGAVAELLPCEAKAAAMAVVSDLFTALVKRAGAVTDLCPTPLWADTGEGGRFRGTVNRLPDGLAQLGGSGRGHRQHLLRRGGLVQQIGQRQGFDQQQVGPEHLGKDFADAAGGLVRAVVAALIGPARQADQGGAIGPSIIRRSSLSGVAAASFISR